MCGHQCGVALLFADLLGARNKIFAGRIETYRTLVPKHVCEGEELLGRWEKLMNSIVTCE